MEIPIIYVNRKHHTGEIREANRRLLDTCVEVTERCVGEVRRVNSEWDPAFAVERMKQLCNPDVLPYRLKRKWSLDEQRTWFALRDELNLGTVPSRVDRRIEEFLEPVGDFKSPFQVLSFWRYAQQRLEFLQGDRGIQTLGTVKSTALTFVESRVVRHALRGIYLTKSENSTI